MEGPMSIEKTRRPACAPHALSTAVLCFGLALTALPASADVLPVSQQRDVSTFALITLPGVEDPFCSDQRASQEIGPFVETIECHVEESGNQATGSAAQLSYILPDFFLAEGSIQAEADISGGADFAEGLGSSRLVSRFSVDEETEIRLMASLHAGGNGSTNLTFRIADGEILILRSIQEASDEVDEWLLLSPATYEWTLTTSGYGQALPEGGGNPAFGSFSSTIEFPAASVETSGGGLGKGLAPVAAPNPFRHGTTLIPASGVRGGDITVLDARGRLIRRFTDVAPGGVSWDARDGRGRPVAAGTYFLRGSGGAVGRAVVIR
jgi:hypothetical protein